MQPSPVTTSFSPIDKAGFCYGGPSADAEYHCGGPVQCPGVPLSAGATGCVSLVYALYEAGVPQGALGRLFEHLPLFDQGFGWLWAALLAIPVSLAGNAIRAKWKK